MSDYNLTLYQYKKSAKSYRKSFFYAHSAILEAQLFRYKRKVRCWDIFSFQSVFKLNLPCFVISFPSFPFGELGRGCYINCYKGSRITSNAMNISKLHVFKGSHKLHVNHSLLGVTY